MRKKKFIENIEIVDSEFPNMGIAILEDGMPVHIKNTLVGQKVDVKLGKKREDRIDGKLFSINERSSLEKIMNCEHFNVCGGCTYQSLEYEDELQYKLRQINKLFSKMELNYVIDEIIPSESFNAYRNKMEYTFGDERKDGPLTLGLHARGRFHDIVDTENCMIVGSDFNIIRSETTKYFHERNVSYYNRLHHEGVLRHLVVRRGEHTGEILLNLVTTHDAGLDLDDYVNYMNTLELEGKIVGVLHTENDSLGDVIVPENVELIYGIDHFFEEVLGLKFKISPFSFFQTNTKSAEKLYSTALEFIGDLDSKTVFDLYSGTGTISQVVALKAKEVYGIEIVEEAVESAKVNAELNGLKNVHFIAEDVFTGVDKLEVQPNLIIVDPPREGINPKAINKIIDFNPKEFLYISCNPKTLVRDLQVFVERGYELKRAVAVDQFPRTSHAEVVTLLSRE